ncbi:hypothetical protein [Candidatus Binatus sp.]|uniref:hypothetical protein n=1 Tax=Candidatus Binatus sp. TaxID=2811406 RepID=UPI003BAFB0B1
MKIGHAPRYQGRLTLAERLQVFRSKGWRAATANELPALCADDGGDLSIIGIPGHLLKRWWSLVEAEDFTLGFEGYAREMIEYLTYKSWIKPGPLLMTVVASGGKHDRALVPSNPMRFGDGVEGAMVACINLDDEKAAIAFKAESGRIRIILEPGEGLLFPERGVLWNRSRVGNSDLAVTLVIGSVSTE